MTHGEVSYISVLLIIYAVFFHRLYGKKQKLVTVPCRLVTPIKMFSSFI